MYSSARHLLSYPLWGRTVVSLNRDQWETQRKFPVLEHADWMSAVSRTCSLVERPLTRKKKCPRNSLELAGTGTPEGLEETCRVLV